MTEKTDWMGRYRPLVAALVHHTNCVAKPGRAHQIYEGIYLTPNEWQVLEYIVEHRRDDQHMIHMSEALGIAQSSFSKMISKLCADGLIERYRSANNKKNIILKPTELAMKVYAFHTSELHEKMFKPFFEQLDGFSDEELERLCRALNTLSGNAGFLEDQTKKAEEKERHRLIKLD